MSKWSNMHERVESYLCTRRSVGYILRIDGEQLQQFASFADQRGHRGHITIDLAVAWATNSQRSCQIGYARRLGRVRALARYCVLFEPKTEIPPPHLLGSAHRRLVPHIYSDQEILQLLEAADDLPSKQGLRPVTIRCLLGLLAATGIRVSEALRLSREDVDLSRGLLLVRQTKFRKTRYVPLHPTVCDALRDYSNFRDQRLPLIRDTEFFLLDDGCALDYWQARYAFRCILSQLGWNDYTGSRRPRLYDLRHTFACRRLLTWYEEGADANQLMPLLATYLGHVKVTYTYWYLTGIPALMTVVAARFEHQAQQNSMGESS
jgi:integrase